MVAIRNAYLGIMLPDPRRLLMTFALRLFPALLVLSASLHASDEAPGLPAMVERIIADRYLIHEQRPHGVVANWANEPRDGTTIDATVGSVNMWGQVYLGVDGDPEALASLRVEIKDIRLMCLTSDGVWHLLHSSATIDGAAYREDFAANEAISADRIINASTGSWAVQMVPNRNFHFWSGGSNGGWTSTAPYEINGLSTIVAMASAYKMRLVASDGVSAPDPDAVTRARLTASCGGDCKRKDDSYGWDWAEGRFRLLTAQWAPVTVATASREVLRTNPPPLFATSDPDWNSPAPVPGWSASDLGHPDNAGWITGQNFDSAGYGASIAGWRVSGGINREDQRITAAGTAPNSTPAAIFDTQGGNSPVAMTITGDAGVKYRPGALYWLRLNLWKGSTAFPYVGRFTYRVFAGDPASGGVQLGSGDVTGDIDGYEAWRNVSWPLSLMTNPMAVAGTPNLFVQFTADAPTNTTGLAQVQLDNIELTDIVTPPTSTTG